ncbi:MAG: hypothetical protein KAT05_17110 [Spirochaetes bacterium]|nr:hypothetical protein [Spirochaetota bacterium]
MFFLIFFISSNLFVIGKQKVDIFKIDFFFNTPVSQSEYYFSSLNKTYSQNIYKKYIYNGLLEILKFINLELEMISEEYKIGSNILYRQKVRATVDANIVLNIFPYIRPVQLASTEYGDIIVLKIKKHNMNKIWSKYNKSPLPIFNINIEQNIIDNYPSWFLEQPEIKGYIFGVGFYNSSSTMQLNFKNADYMARLEIIKTIKLSVKSELNQYVEDNFELFYFFNEQSSKAHIGGIYIIKRYFDKDTKSAFSLAVFKYE